MTLRPGELPGRAIAVFPFLKTTNPIQLGSFSFRSTDDTSDLEKDDASNVREIADMLFLKDDLRIRSASYALLPQLDLGKKIGVLYPNWRGSRRSSLTVTALLVIHSATSSFTSSTPVSPSSARSPSPPFS